MPDARPRLGYLQRTARGLRMRLTISYVVLFSLILISIGMIFRQALMVILNQQSERVLEGEWTALHGFLRLQRGELVWAYNPEDPDESYTVERLRRILLLTTPDGEIIEVSNGYAALGLETRDTIHRVMNSRSPVIVTRTDTHGASYMVRMGLFRDESRSYFVAVGLPTENTMRVPDRLIGVYFLMLPIMLLAVGVLGWYAAGQALHPLLAVVATAKSVSAGNLSLRIPPRGCDDEIEALIDTFNGMMERLEANFEQMRRFTVDASHELRTPLTAIRGQLEVALMTARTPEQFRVAVENTLQDVERMGRIVKSLLDLARAESGQVDLHRAEVQLSALVEQIAAQFAIVAEEKQIQIQVVTPPECSANVDRTQFERLLSNLLSNAVQYTQPQGEVRVELKQANGQIQLVVSDNGPGIAAIHLPRIFERFYRVREGDRSTDKGLGLGLAFAAWIVKAHGGEIDVKSEPGRGTTFYIRLPAAAPEPASTAPAA